MEANAPAGTVNLTLREAPRGFKAEVMAQGGYSDLNKYFGNYKLVGSVSNRFLKHLQNENNIKPRMIRHNSEN